MSYILLFQKFCMSAFSAVRHVLKLLTIKPAAETTLPEEPDIADTQRYCLARTSKLEIALHHSPTK